MNITNVVNQSMPDPGNCNIGAASPHCTKDEASEKSDNFMIGCGGPEFLSLPMCMDMGPYIKQYPQLCLREEPRNFSFRSFLRTSA